MRQAPRVALQAPSLGRQPQEGLRTLQRGAHGVATRGLVRDRRRVPRWQAQTEPAPTESAVVRAERWLASGGLGVPAVTEVGQAVQQGQRVRGSTIPNISELGGLRAEG